MLDTPDHTKERLLAAAERLFAEGGIAGTSLRAITSEAGVNVAAVHYHYGSKQELLRAVFTRRVAPINEERIKLLDALERRSGAPARVAEILEVLVRPALIFVRQHPHLANLAGLLFAEPGEQVRELMEEVFGECTRRYLAALERSLPEIPPEVIRARYAFAIGALVHVGTGRTQIELSHERVVGELVTFLVGGMRAAAAEDGQAASSAGGVRAPSPGGED